jgi:NAD(P)-dependent dehydrogenase (short-subunit alcohol dehydrogenase family)
VLVVGGTSGIGLATARAFAKEGARVAVAARGTDGGARALRALAELGTEAAFFEADVKDEPSIERAIGATMARFGRIDAAVNCAGAGGDMMPLEQTDQSTWDDVMAINARGTWLCMRHEVGPILQSGGGAIINVSSIYGLSGRAAHHAYVASKHAVVGMSRSVGLEFAQRGLRVIALCPGVTATEGMRQAEAAFPEVVRGLVAQHPIGRMAAVDEVASTAVWLCSANAAYVTATAVAVDGGFLAA